MIGLAPKKRPRDRQCGVRYLSDCDQLQYASPTPGEHQREGRGAEIGVEVAFTTMQSAGHSDALGTGRHAFGGPGGWRGGAKGRWKVEEREGVGGPDAGKQNVFFLLFFRHLCFRRNGEKEKEKPH